MAKARGQGLSAQEYDYKFMQLDTRIYIYAGKRVEELKKISAEKADTRKKEYMYRFFFPYFIWGGCVMLFSSF